MIRCFLQQLFILSLVVMLFACSSTNSKPLLIEFSADSSAIEFNHIDPAGWSRLRGLKGNDTTLIKLVSVLQTPSERDSNLKEAPVEGKIVVTDSNLVFMPAVPFVKGRDYLVITHLNARFGDLKMLLKGDVKAGVQSSQKILTR